MAEEGSPETVLSAESPESDVAEWTAPEFIGNDKSFGWYLALAAGSLIFAVLIYIAFKDLVSSVVVIVVAIIFGVYGSHQPRLLKYRLDPQGLMIGEKHHSYDEFKSFSAKPEGEFINISITPLKRFSPYLNIYYSEKDEKAIMAVLASRLPYEEPKRDAIDGLMRKVRF